MSLFNFNHEELLTFFAVLVRYSVLVAVLPILGDRYVPAPVKVLLSLAITIALFPALVSSGAVRPGEALAWGATVGGIATTVASEALLALILGYTARMAFDAINFGGNLTGQFMGFAMATTLDPEQQTQTLVVAEIQMALATLVFLALDGHHLMLRAALQSYEIVGMGRGIALSGGETGRRLVELSAQVIRFGIQIATPVAIALFGVNVAFGVIAKAMPQLNILMLSISVSAMIGLVIMLLSLDEFGTVISELFSTTGGWMRSVLMALASGR